ncbi:MAG: WD40 repeat domain-containing protein [Muribaculaceae bacterium]|nr:WD40 repeat domain-containing protein [Muribaculaceae bacterium]
MMRPYSTTLYTADRHNVYNLAGVNLHNASKDTVKTLEVAPTGMAYFVIEKGKKNKNAALFSTQDKELKRGKFDIKKYGTPVSATFSPDGRTMLIATDRALYIADARTLLPSKRLAGVENGVPTQMMVSPNGFLLAAVNGEKVYVYNLEEQTLRTTLPIGETITDIAFSPDGSDMSVLTKDGVLSIYSTRTFDLRKMVDELGDGINFDYNQDGKYVAVATAPNNITVVNLLNDADREDIPLDGTGLTSINFVPDAQDNTLLLWSISNAVQGKRMLHLKPFYNRLIADETDKLMDEWLKMMPGETMEQYKMRVSDELRAKQRAMFEYQIATELAGNILAGKSLSIGQYDRASQMLALAFDTMPTIFINVPENEVTDFTDAGAVSLNNVLYGVNPDDSFEVVYADVINGVNGKTYTFDNRARAQLDYLNSENTVSLEVLQQQQMEEKRLHELREQVLREAKSQNVISDHTNITVDSRVVPDYDANGNKILNYEVNFTYEVDPDYSAIEDFGPGKYKVNESGAAKSMMKIVKEAFEGDMKQYIENSRRLRINLHGSADATPILHGIAYDGIYGEYDEEPVFIDGRMSALSVNKKDLMKSNEQLAFVRALGVGNFLENNVAGIKNIDRDYRYDVKVSEGKGSEFRRIKLTLTFVDTFK